MGFSFIMLTSYTTSFICLVNGNKIMFIIFMLIAVLASVYNIIHIVTLD